MNEEMKKAYREKMEAQMTEWKAKLVILKAKGLQLKAEATAEYERRLEELQEKESSLMKEMGSFVENGVEKLQILKAKSSVIYREVKSKMDHWTNKNL